MEQPKLCECGCGQPAPLAKRNDKTQGYVIGQPLRFVQGHGSSWNRPSTRAARLSVEVGQRIGRGVVIDADVRIPRVGQGKIGTRAARLLCDCGTEYVSKINNLVGKVPENHRAMSCGCRRYDYSAAARSTSCIDRGAAAARNRVFRSYRKNARQKNLSWDLTDEEFDRLTSLDCYYCGCAPSTAVRRDPGYVEFVYNGIDRVDNALGYVPGNMVTCCKTCNYAKRDMAHDEFMAWIARLTERMWFHPELMPSRLLKGGA